MMRLDAHIDPETLFLNLEEQLKKFPVQLSRVTGKNHELVGLYITKPKNISNPSHTQKSSVTTNCEVTAEERFHLFSMATSVSSSQEAP